MLLSSMGSVLTAKQNKHFHSKKKKKENILLLTQADHSIRPPDGLDSCYLQDQYIFTFTHGNHS